jgi:hypothetical protein
VRTDDRARRQKPDREPGHLQFDQHHGVPEPDAIELLGERDLDSPRRHSLHTPALAVLESTVSARTVRGRTSTEAFRSSPTPSHNDRHHGAHSDDDGFIEGPQDGEEGRRNHLKPHAGDRHRSEPNFTARGRALRARFARRPRPRCWHVSRLRTARENLTLRARPGREQQGLELHGREPQPNNSLQRTPKRLVSTLIQRSWSLSTRLHNVRWAPLSFTR